MDVGKASVSSIPTADYDMGADRDVKRRYRLITDDDFGLRSGARSMPTALPLAAENHAVASACSGGAHLPRSAIRVDFAFAARHAGDSGSYSGRTVWRG